MPNNQKGIFLGLMLMLFCIGSTAQTTSIEVGRGTYFPSQLLEILRSEGVIIAYSNDKLPKTPIKITKKSLEVDELLDILVRESGITVTQKGNAYVISYLPQIQYSLKGIITDNTSGEVLIGASIFALDLNAGVTSNHYGYYSLKMPPGEHIIRINYIGYEPYTDTLFIESTSENKDYAITPRIEELNEVVVSAYEPNLNIESTIPGVNTINLNTKGQLPYFLGEVDVLQGATLLPGINTLGEDANGLSVRGGSVDQNLILLDEATVYNPNHLYGMISIFNPEAVNKIEVMKGYIPPSYGGRASAVMTIHQKEGNYESFHLTGGIGIVSARLIAEGPLKKEVSSFILSARQSLFDLTLDENSTNYFHDFNLKTNWKINPKNTFYVSGYLGNDRSTNVFETDRIWGNRNLSLRWNHLFGQRVFANFSGIYSQYNYKITQPREAASFIGKSNIIDHTLKSDWIYVINNHNELNFGSSSIIHSLQPGERIPFDENSSADTLILDAEYGAESAVYIAHEGDFEKIKFSYGARLSTLLNFSQGEVYTYEDGKSKSDETIIDTVSYDKYEIRKQFTGLEPRASFVYQWTKSISTKISYSKTYQYLHLISNTVTPTPTDIWKLSDEHVSPTISRHYSTGLFFNFKNNNYEAFIDAYYKTLDNLVQYKNGADLLFNNNPETELISGFGRNYGVEFFLKKNQGKLTGWLSYTLSRSEIKVNNLFEPINNGHYYPSNFDRKHDISFVGIYEFSKRLFTSFTFNYNSGRPYTLPVATYNYEGIQVPQYDFRNQNRLPDYHRLDLSVKWHTKNIRPDGTLKKFTDYWTLTIYNVYGRKNVYSYVYDTNELGETEVIPYSIFDSIVPSVTYHFRF